MKKSKILSFLFLCFLSIGFAQEFDYSCEVEKIENKAYYKIALSPELLGSLNNNLSSLRIYDDQHIEQPYLVQQEEALAFNSLFKEYEIIEQKSKADGISYLIFSNPERKAINNVSFVVKNTDVQKRARLSGSKDRKTWYVIKNNYLLHSMHSDDATSELKMLNFPLSDYPYFKLEIDDNWRLPINILKVGYYDTQRSKGLRTEYDMELVSQVDSLKVTRLHFRSSSASYIENLKLEIEGAEYYSRNAKVMVSKTIKRKNKVIETKEYIASANLNSNSNNEIALGGIVCTDLYIEIDNKDNKALQFTGGYASFLNRYVVADLAPEHSYEMKFGNGEMHAPEYDIAFFTNRIPANASKIKHLSIQKKKVELLLKPEVSWFAKPIVIWSVLGVVGMFLVLISMKMIKEIKTRENPN